MKNHPVVALIAFLLLTCNKDEGEDKTPVPPAITLQSVQVSGSKITVSVSIANKSKVAIIDHGYAWGLETPTLENAHYKTLGALNDATNFQGEIPSDLQPNKFYIVRAYYTTEKGIFYSNATGFTSPDIPPVITSFTPASATWGDTIRIAGLRFSPEPEANKITFGDFSAPCVAATNVQLVTVVPSTLNTSNVKLSVAIQNMRVSSGMNFKLLPPAITSFAPVSGNAGTQITINGKNFRNGYTTAYLDGKPMMVSSVTDSQIVAEIPGGLRNGSLELSVSVASQTVLSTARFSYNGLMISEFTPASATYDDIIVIRGVGFSPGITGNKVTFGTVPAIVTEAGPGLLKVAVPHELKTASVKISVSNTQGSGSTPSEFQLLPPEIHAISPGQPTFRQKITITGKNFNPSRRNNIITLNRKTLTPDDATNTSVSFTLWEEYWAQNGISDLTLTIGDQTVQAPFDLEVRSPVISSFTPQTGVRSDAVVVHGENFHPYAILDTIYFGDAYTTATSASANLLTFKVPKGVTGGNHDIRIKVGGKTVTQGTFSVIDSWTRKASMSESGRVRAVAFTIGTKGYAGGGANNSSDLNDFYQYDPSANQWTRKADLPVNSPGMVAFATDNYGYVLYRRQLWRYDPAANTWIQKSSFPGQAFWSQSAFTVNNKAYVGLGQLEWGNVTNEFYEYDEATDQWTRKANFAPGGYQGCASFSAAGKGYVTTGSWMLNDIWEYDPATNSWTKKLSLGGIISGISMSGRMSAVGISTPLKGYFGTGDASAYTSDMYEYDPATNTCVKLIDVPGEGRTNAFGFGINNRIYLGGGTSLLPWGSSLLLSDFYECDPSIKP